MAHIPLEKLQNFRKRLIGLALKGPSEWVSIWYSNMSSKMIDNYIFPARSRKGVLPCTCIEYCWQWDSIQSNSSAVLRVSQPPFSSLLLGRPMILEGLSMGNSLQRKLPTVSAQSGAHTFMLYTRKFSQFPWHVGTPNRWPLHAQMEEIIVKHPSAE